MENNQWQDLCNDIDTIYNVVKNNNKGKTADYIPQLSKKNSNFFGVSIVTTDGRIYECGDFKENFCIQSCCKPMTYALILKEHGIDNVSKHIGREPSGNRFNAMCFDDENKPFNPLINAGAIMACSLVKQGYNPDERYEYVLNKWSSIVGGNNVGFDNAVYLSEKNSANRNYALSYLMMENDIFPENCDMEKTLELYFQCCSVTMNTTSLAKFAALLANGGITVDTGIKIFDPDVVKHTLCVMYSSGMYDYSGRWSFDIGLPAKSGVSGAIYAVVPNMFGICIYSPNLDDIGNSVRGIEFIKLLTQKYRFHIFDTLITSFSSDKKIINSEKNTHSKINDICMLCKKNKFLELEKILNTDNIDINIGDYDDRCPLHIAVEEGSNECIVLLLNHGANLFVKDRWSNYPLHHAIINKNISVILLILLSNYRNNNTIKKDIINNWKSNIKN
jgi:glutaminase